MVPITHYPVAWIKRHCRFIAASCGIVWLVFCQTVAAAPTTETQAAAVVRGWLGNDPAPLGEALPGAVQHIEPVKDGAGGVLCFVVYLQPSGFVIVSPEDGVEPVIAFSSRGRFQASAANPLGALVLNDLPNRVARAIRAGLAGQDPEVIASRRKWKRLADADQGVVLNDSSVTPSDIRIAPLTQMQWSQSTAPSGVACYNYYTPPYSAGNPDNYVSGCVATAMAQLMRYYQYPTTSVGTASYSITVDGTNTSSQLRGGDGSGGPYSWTNMPNVPISPTTNQCQAIGALTYDAAISVQMQFTADSSAASLSDAQIAFQNVFHFNNSVYALDETDGLSSALTNMINPNLDARQPVILGIEGKPGGHAVVCDGYGYSASTLYHHLNLGWAGEDTAWYSLPTIPTVLGTFTVITDCIYNISTNGSGEIISGRVTDNGGTRSR